MRGRHSKRALEELEKLKHTFEQMYINDKWTLARVYEQFKIILGQQGIDLDIRTLAYCRRRWKIKKPTSTYPSRATSVVAKTSLPEDVDTQTSGRDWMVGSQPAEGTGASRQHVQPSGTGGDSTEPLWLLTQGQHSIWMEGTEPQDQETHDSTQHQSESLFGLNQHPHFDNNDNAANEGVGAYNFLAYRYH